MDVLYTAVKNIIIYLILITVVMNLMGDSSFKKYVGIFTGMVLIIIVVLPIMNIFHISDKLTYYLDVNNFKVNTNDISSQLSEAGESQNERILTKYKDSLKEEITTRLSIHGVTPIEIKIVIDEDSNSSECGMVRSIDIAATQKGIEEKEETSKSAIDEIVIDKISINKEKELGAGAAEEEESENVTMDTLLELNIKQELAGFFNLNVEYITVEISD